VLGRLRARGAPRALRHAWERDLARLAPEWAARGWSVVPYPLFEGGAHPEGYVDFECRFAAWHLRRERPAAVLDVGSYRHFVLGLSAALEVTAVDVRPRRAGLGTEAVLTCDARALDAADASFDAVVSLSSVEHCGLGRYGDPLDPDGDVRAAAEMRRVLRPGGVLVLTTPLTRGVRTVAFNAHRIYDLATARALFAGLEPVDERCFSLARREACALDEATDAPGAWDVYCGCWRRPA
jgi:SAM-dependent methyltransferase